MSSYTNNFVNQITSRGVAGSIDVLGIANPTASVTVNTISANRQGEYFHYPLSVANSSAQYPDVTVVSTYGATQTSSGKVFVPATPENYGYDSDGNLTSDGRWTHILDGENRLIEMKRDSSTPTGAQQRLTFEYDHQSRRIRKTFYTWVSSAWAEQRDTTYLYDGWNLVAELDANNSNAKLRTFVWGTDLSGTAQGAGGVGGLLWANNAQGTINGQTVSTGIQFAAYDGNGNVSGLVAASDSSITARYEYGPFAEPLRTTGPLAKANPIRFSTKVTDDESGLIYYGFRYYNPTTGRWQSRDPIAENGGHNLYSFVDNQPISFLDPLGLDLFSVVNSPCGKNTIPIKGTPDGEAYVVQEKQASVATRLSVSIIVMTAKDDGVVGPFPAGTKWFALMGDEEAGALCHFKYTCAQKCKCCNLTTTNTWGGANNMIYGIVFSHYAFYPDGRMIKDAKGKPTFTNAKCMPDRGSLKKAEADCKNTSAGKCDTVAVLKSR